MATVNSEVLKTLDDFNQRISSMGGGVVESWDDGKGNWYRKYSDGFIIQGGCSMVTSSVYGEVTVTLNTEFKTTSYVAIKTLYTTEAQNREGVGVASKTTTSFTCYERTSMLNVWRDWIACGY